MKTYDIYRIVWNIVDLPEQKNFQKNFNTLVLNFILLLASTYTFRGQAYLLASQNLLTQGSLTGDGMYFNTNLQNHCFCFFHFSVSLLSHQIGPCANYADSAQTFFVLGFNDMSTLVGHFVSSPRERETRDRGDSRGDEREGLREERGTGMKVKKQKK